jgi:hypothetical protein
MLQEIKNLEAQLKQILYGCVEHVQATKAALYLSSSSDLNEKTFEIVTSYQYNPADRRTITANDDLVDRLAVKRSAFFVNGLGADARLAEMLFRQGNDRVLAVPMFSRGRMVGFIDMRDKAGKKPFESSDVEAGSRIAEQVLALLGANNLFGLAPIALVNEPAAQQPAAAPARPADGPRTPITPQPALRAGQIFSPEAARAVEGARHYMSRRQLTTQQQGGRRALSDSDIEIARLVLPSALSMPSAVVACLSAAGHTGNPKAIVAVAQISADAIELIEAHLQAWLKKSNQPHLTLRPDPAYPFGAQPVPVTGSTLTAIISAPLAPASVEGLLLTVAFERTAEPVAQRLLQIFLKQVEPAVDSAIASASARIDRSAVAERLLEPDFQKYPDLVGHARETAVIAQRFAQSLDLPPTQVDVVRIAALVHDVGLRMLDYDRFYRRSNLSPEELRGIAEHPVIGAALVEPLLGAEVAQAVLRHHERFDGKGYPSRLTGQQIPLAARILAVVDAWVAMTSTHSYQPVISREEAVKKLQDGAGSQFDPALVERFLRSLPDVAG